MAYAITTPNHTETYSERDLVSPVSGAESSLLRANYSDRITTVFRQRAKEHNRTRPQHVASFGTASLGPVRAHVS